jgi:hypothetical protein
VCRAKEKKEKNQYEWISDVSQISGKTTPKHLLVDVYFLLHSISVIKEKLSRFSCLYWPTFI